MSSQDGLMMPAPPVASPVVVVPIAPIPIVVVAIVVVFVDFIGNHRTAGAPQPPTDDRAGLAPNRAAHGSTYRPAETAAQCAVQGIAGKG